MRTVLLPFLLLSTLAGCARYEFDVIEPAELATHVGRNKDTQAVVQREPLTYVMRAVEGRLVMHVENNTDTPIELLGGRSYVVDPGEQSHPLPTMAIAPDSYVKVVLPPMRPYVRPSPSIGFGLGVGISSVHGRRSSVGTGVGVGYGTGGGGPVYLADGPGNIYWDWEGETPVRLRLTYQREDESFVHDFVIRRVKVK